MTNSLGYLNTNKSLGYKVVIVGHDHDFLTIADITYENATTGEKIDTNFESAHFEYLVKCIAGDRNSDNILGVRNVGDQRAK